MKSGLIKIIYLFFIFTLGFISCQTHNCGGCSPVPIVRTFLSYTGALSPTSSEVFLFNLNDSVKVQLTHLAMGQTGHSGQSVMTNFGGLYFLSDSGGQSTKKLYFISENGSGIRRVLQGLNNYQIYSVAGSIENQFVYVLYNDCSICKNLGGVNVKLGVYNLLLNTFNNIGSAYSHAEISTLDRNTIYFDYLDSITHIPHIFSMKSDGTGKKQLTNSSNGEEYPSLSPDGKTIALASFIDPGHKEEEICLINPDGTNLRQITRLSSTTIAHQPCWSINSDQVFFSSFNSVNSSIPPHIYSVRTDGSGIKQYTSGNGETYPSVGVLPIL